MTLRLLLPLAMVACAGGPEPDLGTDGSASVPTATACDDGGRPTASYIDADGDGFGDPSSATISCEPPSADRVGNGDDCDDTSVLARPGGTEVCDGLDNDCSGVADSGFIVVPRDHGTLTEAVAAVADFTEICLSPGTYDEIADLDGRKITVTGAPGTVFDLSGAQGPRLAITDPATDLTLQGLEVSGLDRVVTTVMEEVPSFLSARAGRIALQDVRFTDLRVAVRPGGALLAGAVIYAQDAALDLTRVSIEGFELELGAAPDMGGNARAIGGFLGADDVGRPSRGSTCPACAFMARAPRIAWSPGPSGTSWAAR